MKLNTSKLTGEYANARVSDRSNVDILKTAFVQPCQQINSTSLFHPHRIVLMYVQNGPNLRHTHTHTLSDTYSHIETFISCGTIIVTWSTGHFNQQGLHTKRDMQRDHTAPSSLLRTHICSRTHTNIQWPSHRHTLTPIEPVEHGPERAEQRHTALQPCATHTLEV